MSADAGVLPVSPYSKADQSAEFSLPYLQVMTTGERWGESGSSAVLSNSRPDEPRQPFSKPRQPSRKTKALRPPTLLTAHQMIRKETFYYTCCVKCYTCMCIFSLNFNAGKRNRCLFLFPSLTNILFDRFQMRKDIFTEK